MALTPSLLFKRDKADKAAAQASTIVFKPALLIVDMQNDFCDPEGGALPVHGGALDLAQPINQLLQLPGFVLRVATLTSPPEHHKALTRVHGNDLPSESHVELKNTKVGYEHETTRQKLWPRHCHPGTWGHRIIDGINKERIDLFVKKNMHPDIMMYSAFKDTHGNSKEHMADGAVSHQLDNELKAAGVTHVYCVGIAGDYSVVETAIDAADAGFHAYVIEDLTRSFDSTGEGWNTAMRLMRLRGVQVIKLDGSEVQRVKEK